MQDQFPINGVFLFNEYLNDHGGYIAVCTVGHSLCMQPLLLSGKKPVCTAIFRFVLFLKKAIQCCDRLQ